MGIWLDATFYNFDVAIYNFICQFQNPVTVFIANACQNMGDFRAYMVYLAISLILCIPKKTRKYGIALLAAWLFGTALVNYGLKPSIARLRPYVTLKDTPFWDIYNTYWTYAGNNLEGDMSFPSGHTSTNFEMWTAFAATLSKDKKKWAWAFLIIPIIVGLSRIIRCVHYPSDVLFGMFFGLLAGFVGYLCGQIYFKKIKGKKILFVEL